MRDLDSRCEVESRDLTATQDLERKTPAHSLPLRAKSRRAAIASAGFRFLVEEQSSVHWRPAAQGRDALLAREGDREDPPIMRLRQLNSLAVREAIEPGTQSWIRNTWYYRCFIPRRSRLGRDRR
jgi:hypothetical protein